MAQRLPVNEQVAFQQPTGGPPPSLSQVPSQGLVEAGAAIGQQIGAALGAANALEDFAYEQEAEYQLQQTKLAASIDVQERLNLPDGDDRSFFDSKGNYRPVVMQNLMHQYGKNLASLRDLPLSASRRASVAGKVAQAGLGLIEDFTFAGMQAQQKRALSNFENNYQLALQTGDFVAAEQAALDGARAGLYSTQQGDLLAFQARKKGALDDLNATLIDSPRAAISRLNSGEFDQYTTPAERAKIRKDAAAVYEDAARRGEAEAMVLTAKDVEPLLNDPQIVRFQKLVAANPAYSLPLGTADENAHWQKLVLNPDDRQARAALLNMATLEANSQKPGAADEAARDEFVKRYTRFGIFPDADIERIWKDGQKAASEATTVSIDAKTHIDTLFAAGDYVNAEEYAAFKQELESDWSAKPEGQSGMLWWAEKHGVGKFYAQHADAVRRKAKQGMDEKADEDAVKLQAASSWVAEKEAQHKAEIISSYNAWRAKEGKDASPLAQRTQLNAICKAVLGRDEDVPLGSVELEERAYQRAVIGQTRAAEDFAAQNKRNEAFAFPSLDFPIVPFRNNVSSTFAEEGDKLNLNEIRLPASMMEGVRIGVTEMLIQSPTTGKAMKVVVVDQCEGNSPQLSDELGVFLQVRPGETRAFDMRMLSPAAGARLGAVQTERQIPQVTKVLPADKTLDIGPLVDYTDAFSDAGTQNGVDPNLLLAISLHETDRGRSEAFLRKNNAMGISDANGPTRQASVADSIHRMASLLGSSRLYADWRKSGKLSDLQKVYAPVGAGNDQRGLNKHWQDGVRKYYKQLTGKDLK